jgi:hypothetical protein
MIPTNPRIRRGHDGEDLGHGEPSGLVPAGQSWNAIREAVATPSNCPTVQSRHCAAPATAPLVWAPRSADSGASCEDQMLHITLRRSGARVVFRVGTSGSQKSGRVRAQIRVEKRHNDAVPVRTNLLERAVEAGVRAGCALVRPGET